MFNKNRFTEETLEPSHLKAQTVTNGTNGQLPIGEEDDTKMTPDVRLKNLSMTKVKRLIEVIEARKKKLQCDFNTGILSWTC